MDENQSTWLFTGMTILIAFAIGVCTSVSLGQKNAPQSTKGHTTPDYRRYPVADLNVRATGNESERREREKKSKRYDKQPMIIQSPGANDTLVVVYDAEPVPEALPSGASTLIIIGTVRGSSAFVSANGKGIYSEFELRIESVLRNRTSQEFSFGDSIFIDRAGGVLQYPSGQKVLYLNSWQDLPHLERRYLFFLDRHDGDESPNFRIITGYQLEADSVIPLDRGEKFSGMSGLKPARLISLVMDSVK